MIPGLLDTISGAVKGLFGNDGISGLIDNVTTTKEEKLELQAKISEIQNKFETNLQQVLLEREKAFLADIADARNREIQIATSDKAPLINKVIQPVLALLLLGSCFAIWYTILFKDIDPKKEMIIAGIVGSLTTIAMGVVGYYFGSSVGSKANGDSLRKLVDKG